LTKVVKLHLGEFNDQIELVASHACLFKGRWFAHVILRHRGRLASILVTRLENSASLAAKEQPAKSYQHGQVIACSTVAGYQISCFRTARHAVLVVSDLTEGENLALAREMATPIYEHITRAEKVT
jgi:microcystin degradation protein MlrC